MLKDYGLQPKKGLGQNFLVEDVYLQRIVEAAGVTSADEVLEIGAGLGSLTRLPWRTPPVRCARWRSTTVSCLCSRRSSRNSAMSIW